MPLGTLFHKKTVKKMQNVCHPVTCWNTSKLRSFTVYKWTFHLEHFAKVVGFFSRGWWSLLFGQFHKFLLLSSWVIQKKTTPFVTYDSYRLKVLWQLQSFQHSYISCSPKSSALHHMTTGTLKGFIIKLVSLFEFLITNYKLGLTYHATTNPVGWRVSLASSEMLSLPTLVF